MENRNVATIKVVEMNTGLGQQRVSVLQAVVNRPDKQLEHELGAPYLTESARG